MVHDVVTCFHCKKPLVNGIVLARMVDGCIYWEMLWHTYCPIPVKWKDEMKEVIYYYV